MKHNYFKETNKLFPKIKNAKFVKYEKKWSTTPHIDKYNELIYIKEGNCTLWTKDNEKKGKKGDFIFVPANTFHKDMFTENSNFKVYFITFALPKELHFKPSDNLSEKRKNLIKRELDKIISEYNYNNYIANISLYKILLTMNYNFKEENIEKNKIDYSNFIDKVKDIIKKEYSKNINLEYLSLKLEKSTFHISHIFNKYNDIKLSEYITKIRLQNATELLMNSNYNISQIAYKTGFNDPHYFTNVFKSYFGITPKEYRQTYNPIKI